MLKMRFSSSKGDSNLKIDYSVSILNWRNNKGDNDGALAGHVGPNPAPDT